ncbi:hypothetical protein GGR58DRAFT_281477 [Xylaria digitata]|nr:hypothetical protein GGR58DRAFT_281477 [Xylaria digitata]
MENPEEDISGVIRSLTQGTRREQEKALNDYFLPDACFVHPFCRVPSFGTRVVRLPFTNTQWTINSRSLIHLIYQWYKIMSPTIQLEVESTAFDKKANSLYATVRQTFTVWVIPFSLWQANVKLVCLLDPELLPVRENNQPLLPRTESAHEYSNNNSATSPRRRYFIRGQQDHYQLNDVLKFIAPFGVPALYYLWQLFATFLSVIGAALLWPVTSFYERDRTDKKSARESY